jgi:hypothetical protein
LVVSVPRIFGPLPDIPVHVIETECIGLERSDRRCLLVTPLIFATTAVGVVLSNVVAPGIAGRGARTRRILKLGLREQPVIFAGQA